MQIATHTLLRRQPIQVSVAGLLKGPGTQRKLPRFPSNLPGHKMLDHSPAGAACLQRPNFKGLANGSHASRIAPQRTSRDFPGNMGKSVHSNGRVMFLAPLNLVAWLLQQ